MLIVKSKEKVNILFSLIGKEVLNNKGVKLTSGLNIEQ